MPSWQEVTNVWKNIQEVDLRPMREAAEEGFRVAIIGAPNTGRKSLADQMRQDPSKPTTFTPSPVLIAEAHEIGDDLNADLIVLLLTAVEEDTGQERLLVRKLNALGRPVLVFVNHQDPLLDLQSIPSWTDWGAARVICGEADNPDYLLAEFVPAVMALLPDRHLSLGRQFPLFRIPVARKLINETCFANAAYALSTGLAEIVPVLDIPLNIADILVLTKAQAFLVYKLGLLLGHSTRWQEYVTEFSGVLGGGFLWRQIARQLVGLIPVWGIAPKVAVAYSGTYVVGQVVLRWYLTGRHATRQQIRKLYASAFTRGKEIASDLTAKAKHPRFRRRKQKTILLPEGMVTCAFCGKHSASDAHYCQYCGESLLVADIENPPPATTVE
jgi:uncharacterized protein (DUF697 family)